jgi:glycerol-3-phosphate dehydrogenase
LQRRIFSQPKDDLYFFKPDQKISVLSVPSGGEIKYMLKTEVIVIGGGATGAGVLRDLALRGIEAILLEKSELTSGTSGRNHGLLHSGARYAVNDPDSGRECISENSILKKIAAPCIEDSGGFFVALPEDPPDYPEKLLRACEHLNIPAKEISPLDALQEEPAISPKITRAIRVPDGSLDPFRLIRANVEDAERYGAKFFSHREVIDILKEGDRIQGVKVQDPRTGEIFSIRAHFIINASGVWAGKVARLAGASLEVLFSKGSLVVLSQRLVNTVINRCRPPSSGDILVPNGPALILGTTSNTVEEIDNPSSCEEEVDLLISEGEKMVPEISFTRAIRSYAGVRPLMGAREGQEDGRKISRDFLALNHGETDGVKGFYSIVGGKLTTYRLMAERVVDALCQEMGNRNPCSTAERPLPFPIGYVFHDLSAKLSSLARSNDYRGTEEIFCECELVSQKEIIQEIQNIAHPSLNEMQQRTRAGMGPCQGGFCSHRLTALMAVAGKISPAESLPLLKNFLEERWKGIRPVLWGPQLREEQLIQALYTELFNLDHHLNSGKEASGQKQKIE